MVKSFVLNKGLISLFLLSLFLISFKRDLLFASSIALSSYSFFLLKTTTSNSLFLNSYFVNFKLEPSFTATPNFEFWKFKFDISPLAFSPKLRPLSLIFEPSIKLPTTFAPEISKQSLFMFSQKIFLKFKLLKKNIKCFNAILVKID